MSNEQIKTLNAIRIAIKMEIDGKEYYLKAGQSTGNKAGARLLRSLSKAEDAHREKFISIYESIRDKNTWPKVTIRPAGKGLRTIFAEASSNSRQATPPAEELDAVKVAMKMENKTLDYYTRQAGKASSETEKNFYNAIAAEEREHHMVLQDYYEFLKDPAGWFVKAEHHSLDGG